MGRELIKQTDSQKIQRKIVSCLLIPLFIFANLNTVSNSIKKYFQAIHQDPR